MRLFADNDFPAGSHVLASLCGSLVLSGLQSDDGLTGLERLLGELAFRLVGWFRSQVWSGPFRVSVSL